MRCPKCKSEMKPKKGIEFEGTQIDGYVCKCGEVFYDSERAQEFLIDHKKK